jgi:hypothetical protein
LKSKNYNFKSYFNISNLYYNFLSYKLYPRLVLPNYYELSIIFVYKLYPRIVLPNCYELSITFLYKLYPRLVLPSYYELSITFLSG